MRIAHIIDNLWPGGTEGQCVRLARELSRIGVENAVFYFRPGPLLEELNRSGVTARPVPQERVRSGRFPIGVVRLARAIGQWEPDIAQTYGFYSDLRGLPAARLAGVRTRIAGRRELGRFLSRTQRRADRLVWGLAERIVVNSDAVRRQLIAEDRVPPPKLVVIRNGLDPAQWLVPPGVPDDNGDAVVGMVAHFREDKDHAMLLRAAREVLAVVPAVRFRLIGSGVLEASMREYTRQLGIADRVDFLGSLAPQEVRAVVRNFRVAVLASKCESLPNAVLEAMAAGLPVVATAVGGIPEIIQEGVTGFLVPPGDSGALGERIIHLLKEPSLARRMGNRGRQRLEREFSLTRMVSEFHALYSGLLAGTRDGAS